MRIRDAVLVFSIMSAFALAGCGSGQSSNTPSESRSTQPRASSPIAQTDSYHAKLALVGQPTVTADGKNVEVTVTVTNDGSGTFGSAADGRGVNLGAHSIDSNGKIVNQDLARGNLPQITPRATQQVTILLPVTGVLGHRAELLPVDEGVAWFDAWGTKPLVVGPFEACSNSSAGTVCDASGKPLSVAKADH